MNALDRLTWRVAKRQTQAVLDALKDGGFVVVPREDVRLVLRVVNGRCADSTRQAAERLYGYLDAQQGSRT